MNVYKIVFSPTGGTKKAVDCLCECFDSDSVIEVDLCQNECDFSSLNISSKDLAIVAMPVFGGRVPELAVSRLRQIKANDAKCAVMAVYGNRAFDDALLEMINETKNLGFTVIAAIGAVAEHSIVREYGKGRPDNDDAEELKQFGLKIAQKVADENCSTPVVPGNFPYKKSMAGPKPTATRKCAACGICAKQCPVGAISFENPRKVDKAKCISCMRCVAICPHHARGIGKIMNFLIALAIKKPCALRKDNKLYI